MAGHPTGLEAAEEKTTADAAVGAAPSTPVYEGALATAAPASACSAESAPTNTATQNRVEQKKIKYTASVEGDRGLEATPGPADLQAVAAPASVGAVGAEPKQNPLHEPQPLGGKQ